ncbi:MAG: guanine deaminase, partial [Pseudomonadota bacterium]
MTNQPDAVSIHLGQIITFDGDPFQSPWDSVTHVETAGAIAVSEGKIVDIGPYAEVIERHPGATQHDHGTGLILPGFVDAHVHYPQTAIIASWGKRLIDWLNTYTFPEEMRLTDPAYATQIANR